MYGEMGGQFPPRIGRFSSVHFGGNTNNPRAARQGRVPIKMLDDLDIVIIHFHKIHATTSTATMPWYGRGFVRWHPQVLPWTRLPTIVPPAGCLHSNMQLRGIPIPNLTRPTVFSQRKCMLLGQNLLSTQVRTTLNRGIRVDHGYIRISFGSELCPTQQYRLSIRSRQAQISGNECPKYWRVATRV